jgi:putative PIG3 family NAD(P)H quinone oxidoreductase
MNPTVTSARAVRIRGKGGVEALELGPYRPRDPGPGEVLVEVAAAALNRADILQRKGFYPAPPGAPADIPGLEYAGTVVATGEGVRSFARGDRVMGIVAGGAMATHLVVHEREAIPVPEGMPLHDAAAVPEVFLTAYDALFVQGGLRLGERVLVHAVGSGVGTAALQLALAVGARPIGTSRTVEKLDRCRAYGLVDGVVADGGRFAERVRELTGGAGVDAILDTVGAAYLAENVAALAPRGRVVVVGLLGGAKGELPLGALLEKRGRVIGTVLRSRPLEEKAALARDFAAHALPLFAAGKLRPVVDAVLPMEEIREAHGRMERNETFGKVVLVWGAAG